LLLNLLNRAINILLLPWDAPLTRLQQSLSGPVAGAIAIIALVAIGVTLVFGGDWNEFAHRAVYAICAIAFIISASALLGGLFAVRLWFGQTIKTRRQANIS
jgi:type IV secretory pathway VirB2 component (pilin)